MSNYESRSAVFRSWRQWGDDASRALTWERDAAGCWALRDERDQLVGAALPVKDPKMGPWCAITAIRGRKLAAHRFLASTDAKKWVQVQIKTGVKNVRFNSWKRAAAPSSDEHRMTFAAGVVEGMFSEIADRMARWNFARWTAFVMSAGAAVILIAHWTLP